MQFHSRVVQVPLISRKKLNNFPQKVFAIVFPRKKTSSGRLLYWSFVKHAKNLSIKIQEISLETMKENIKYWVSRKTFQKVPLSTYEAVLTSLPTRFQSKSEKKLFYLRIFSNCNNPQFFCTGRLPFWQRCRQIVRKIARKMKFKKIYPLKLLLRTCWVLIWTRCQKNCWKFTKSFLNFKKIPNFFSEKTLLRTRYCTLDKRDGKCCSESAKKLRFLKFVKIQVPNFFSQNAETFHKTNGFP